MVSGCVTNSVHPVHVVEVIGVEPLNRVGIISLQKYIAGIFLVISEEEIRDTVEGIVMVGNIAGVLHRAVAKNKPLHYYRVIITCLSLLGIYLMYLANITAISCEYFYTR